MKVIRTAALSRLIAPDFVVIFGLELIQLRKLDDFAFRLLVELAALADFVTGRIETSYAVLVALLDHDRAPCANVTSLPTVKRVRHALQTLVDMNLVLELDREENERRKRLFFRLPGRTRRPSSEAMRGRLQGRPKKPAKRAPARAAGRSSTDAGQTAGQGVQQEKAGPPQGAPPPSLARVFPPAPEPAKDSITQREMKARIAAARKK